MDAGTQPALDLNSGQRGRLLAGAPEQAHTPALPSKTLRSACAECLHGVVDDTPHSGPPFAATSFPAPISLAASFDAGLAHSVGSAVGREARAMYNLQRAADGTVRQAWPLCRACQAGGARSAAPVHLQPRAHCG